MRPSFTALMPELPVVPASPVIISPGAVVIEMLPVFLLNAKIPLFEAAFIVAPGETLIVISPGPPLSAKAAIPSTPPEIVVPERSFTVTFPFAKLKASIASSAGAVMFAPLLMMRVPFAFGSGDVLFPYPAQIPSGTCPLLIAVVPAFIEPEVEMEIKELADAKIVVAVSSAPIPVLPALIFPLLLIVILPEPWLTTLIPC